MGLTPHGAAGAAAAAAAGTAALAVHGCKFVLCFVPWAPLLPRHRSPSPMRPPHSARRCRPPPRCACRQAHCATPPPRWAARLRAWPAQRRACWAPWPPAAGAKRQTALVVPRAVAARLSRHKRRFISAPAAQDNVAGTAQTKAVRRRSYTHSHFSVCSPPRKPSQAINHRPPLLLHPAFSS
jgi:hypothetical protein